MFTIIGSLVHQQQYLITWNSSLIKMIIMFYYKEFSLLSVTQLNNYGSWGVVSNLVPSANLKCAPLSPLHLLNFSLDPWELITILWRHRPTSYLLWNVQLLKKTANLKEPITTMKALSVAWHCLVFADWHTHLITHTQTDQFHCLKPGMVVKAVAWRLIHL